MSTADPADADLYADVDLIPDLCRVDSPWRQLLRDMTAPAPMSHWAAEVTTRRIMQYDRMRPYVTRAAFLALVAAFLSLAPATSWLTWVLLLPAVVQVVLEMLLERFIGTSDTHDRSSDGPNSGWHRSKSS